MDNVLSERPYLAGDYSIADMASFPWVTAYKRYEVDLDKFENVRRWFDELKNRLVLRRSDSDDAIENRLVNAKKELESAELFDYIVLNDNFNQTVKELSSIIFNINHEYNKQDNLNILRDLLEK